MGKPKNKNKRRSAPVTLSAIETVLRAHMGEVRALCDRNLRARTRRDQLLEDWMTLVREEASLEAKAELEKLVNEFRDRKFTQLRRAAG